MDDCFFYRVLHTALPFLFILSFGRAITSRGAAWVTLSGITAYQVCLFVLVMILGHLKNLRGPWYRVGFVSLAVVTTILALRNIPALLRAVRSVRYKPRLVDPLLLAASVLTALSIYFQWVYDWTIGPTHFDSMTYHVPRALLWFHYGSFDAWRTAIWQQIGHAFGGAAELQPNIFLGCGWLGGSWTGMVDTLGAAVAVFMIQTCYGIPTRGALLGALAFMSFPTVGMRVNEVNTDIAAVFPVLAGVTLFLTARSLSNGILLYTSLVGLGVAAKAYVLFAAIPISIALFVPRIRALWQSPRILPYSLLGVILAATCFLLSYGPVYATFGALDGGRTGRDLAAWAHPLAEIPKVTGANVVTWLFEPLMIIPDSKRESVFEFLRMKELYEWLGLSTRWFPQLHSGENRTGIFPLLLLPWLIFAVPPRFRLAILALFIAVFCSLTSTLSLNLGAPRFALLSSALFAALWGLRGARNPLLVGAMVLFASWIPLNFLMRSNSTNWLPNYSEEKEPYKKVGDALNSDPLLIFSRGLAVDAFASGRHGRWHFEYIDCPPVGMTYHDWLLSLKERSHWIKLDFDSPRSRYGPLYQSNLGRVCDEITREDLKRELENAGWKYFTDVSYVEQVWRAD